MNLNRLLKHVVWCYKPMYKIFYGGHLGSHLAYLKTTRHQIYFNSIVPSNRINIKKLTVYA